MALWGESYVSGWNCGKWWQWYISMLVSFHACVWISNNSTHSRMRSLPAWTLRRDQVQKRARQIKIRDPFSYAPRRFTFLMLRLMHRQHRKNAMGPSRPVSARLGVRDFEICWISRGFRISDWISGFQDFKVDSGFCLKNYYLLFWRYCSWTVTSSQPRCTQNTMSQALHSSLLRSAYCVHTCISLVSRSHPILGGAWRQG